METTDGGFFFIGCNSPPATTQQPGAGFIRLRWGGSVPLMAYNSSTGLLENIQGKRVKSITIVFDEGYDTAPTNFGLAVLDNINVNGVLVGEGAGERGDRDEDENDHDRGHGNDD